MHAQLRWMPLPLFVQLLTPAPHAVPTVCSIRAASASVRQKCAFPLSFLRPIALLMPRSLCSYSVVEKIEEIEDCLAIGQKLPDGDERLCVRVYHFPASKALQSFAYW